MERLSVSDDAVATSLRSLLSATGCRAVEELSELLESRWDLDGECEVVVVGSGSEEGIELCVGRRGQFFYYPFRLAEMDSVVEELDVAYDFDTCCEGLADEIGIVEGLEVIVSIDYHVDPTLLSPEIGRRHLSFDEVVQTVPGYPYERAMSGTKTYQEWKSVRVERNFRGLQVELVNQPDTADATLDVLRASSWGQATRRVAPSSCPKCGGAIVEIVYGMPGSELFEAAERGEVVLGGCCLPIHGDPTRSCPCGHITDG